MGGLNAEASKQNLVPNLESAEVGSGPLCATCQQHATLSIFLTSLVYKSGTKEPPRALERVKADLQSEV